MFDHNGYLRTWTMFQATATLVLLVFMISFHPSECASEPVEVRALQAIRNRIGDVFHRLSNWEGEDPCRGGWTGVICTTINGTDHVTELRLLNMNFTGNLAPDFGDLRQLVIMNFMWNNITGSIPREIARLRNLVQLSLSGNKLTGVLDSSFGNLSSLDRLQIDENKISGPIPSSFQFLNSLVHFHMNNNSLNGSIPPELGRLPRLAHLLLDNNQLNGEIPGVLSNISTLSILQLDNNQFNGSIPSSFQGFSSNLTKLSLRNCGLNGTIPNLSGLSALVYLDLSNNQLSGPLPSKLSQTVRTIDLSNNRLDGEIPAGLYGLRQMELLELQNNYLDGVVKAELFSHDSFTNGESVFIMDFRNNNFTDLVPATLLAAPNITLMLDGNPGCSGSQNFSVYCNVQSGYNVTTPLPPIRIPTGCSESMCGRSPNQELNYGLLKFGLCQCAFPITVGYRLKSPSFAIYQPYADALQEYLTSRLFIDPYQVNVSGFNWIQGPRLYVNVKVFPPNGSAEFNSSEASRLYSQFATFNISENRTFGPHEILFISLGFSEFLTYSSKVVMDVKWFVAIVIGLIIITITLSLAIVIHFARKPSDSFSLVGRRADRRHARIKVDGVRDFTFEEMMAATNSFDSRLQVGQGGYGRVYKGILPDGRTVAIKRATGSLQGDKEFVTELEILSRLHHKNLVSLVGFCDDQGEQMLIYEFMENGTLRDHLNSTAKPPLDFARRIQIALGSARAILYLHTEADPPLIHRDIKAANILLDQNLAPKVADFGISKLAPPPELEGAAAGHVSTLVKGTPGYLDPEYFFTQKLTDRSDVYSFGVVLLELLTGQYPILNGKNLVREVNMAYEAGMILSLVDSSMGQYPHKCLEPFVRLAVQCCMEHTTSRPSMAEVVRELERIWDMLSEDCTSSNDNPSSSDNPMASVGLNSMLPKASLPYHPYVSSDIDGNNLLSDTIPPVMPR